MKVTYKLKKDYPYQKEPSEYQIDLDDSFEFSESYYPCETFGYKHYLCVVEEASRFKEVLESLGSSQAVDIYTLPLDTVIISLSNVKFNPPHLISLESINEKLKKIKEETVWVNLQTDTLNILNVYKLSWISGDEDVTLCFIDDDDSIIYRKSQLLNSIEENVFDFSDYTITQTLTGEEAKILWNSLLGKVLRKIGYNPKYDHPDYKITPIIVRSPK